MLRFLRLLFCVLRFKSVGSLFWGTELLILLMLYRFQAYKNKHDLLAIYLRNLKTSFLKILIFGEFHVIFERMLFWYREC